MDSIDLTALSVLKNISTEYQYSEARETDVADQYKKKYKHIW